MNTYPYRLPILTADAGCMVGDFTTDGNDALIGRPYRQGTLISPMPRRTIFVVRQGSIEALSRLCGTGCLNERSVSVDSPESPAPIPSNLMNSSNPQTRRVAVFSDFDGTIAHPDTINLLAETHGGLEFRRDISRKIASGEISLREGIAAEVATIRGSLDEVLDFLKQHVEVDQSFPAFAHWCRRQAIPLTVLSAGIKDVIEQLLAPYGLDHIRLLANPLEIIDNRWTLCFLDDTPWGHDKAASLVQAKSEGYATVFLGDGLSDLRAANQADLVFARGKLARICQDKQLPFLPLDDFSGVDAAIAKLLMEDNGNPTRRS